ncbi:antibiotic biosynthesis monooxygenase [Rossellomorea aquimaris]|uniref:putative quinol monooxygenase n=1 Tax=Rossellomorea aquimaris TaxID=189382 RepID=UPI001CD3A1E6|nr:putative quinol monooxygenase [Rossellomorea aquimaris]MCA1055880.1 antibiotic biosynthesis monooxygenase [Rossellomorea aquimaris]
MDEITITAVLKAKAGKEEELRQALLDVVPPSRAEKGCILYVLHESREEEGTFVFYEKWMSQEALESHIGSEHYGAYRERAAELVDSREVYKLKTID